MSEQLFRIAVHGYKGKLLTYTLPDHIQSHACVPGSMVEVPLRNEHTIGIIYEQQQPGQLVDISKQALRPISQMLPWSLSSNQIQLASFISDYWFGDIADSLLAFLPSYLAKNYLSLLEKQLANSTPQASLASSKAAAQAQSLGLNTGELHTHELSNSNLAALQVDLNPEQKKVSQAITSPTNQYQVHALYGITGSGKTHVYMQAANQVLRQGKKVLWLLPEISLVSAQMDWILEHACGPVAVYHSGISAKKQFNIWLSSKEPGPQLILGTRSASLLDLTGLDYIIIDEEHDSSYYQAERLVYSARNLSIARARFHDIPIVLGSATPSLETLSHVQKGTYQLHRLTQRVQQSSLPSIACTETTSELLSSSLVERIRSKLEQGEQVLLSLNLRGYARTLSCGQCNWKAICPHCDKDYIVHLAKGKIACHLCDRSYPLSSQCPECSATQLDYTGFGTEQLAHYCRDIFQDFQVLQFDMDTNNTWNKLQKNLGVIASEEPMVIVATQMLTKGHHFPNITLAILLQFDKALSFPGYRAEEEAWQLAMQVAGRSGRSQKPGEVLIQSSKTLPLDLLTKGDYLTLAQGMLKFRQKHQLPPQVSLASIQASGLDKQAVTNRLQDLADRLTNREVDIKGPYEGNPGKINNRYRSILILRGSRKYLRACIQRFSRIPTKPFDKVQSKVLVDPLYEL